MATETDNLDARMEAIRLKNEELEKKHREIQEDEQNAKLMDAVVDVRYTEIPKVHPYDNIDLDFDVKDADKELVKNPDYKPKNRRPLPRKELLDEIPPDPVNFLREDGGDEKARAEPNQNQRPSNSKNRTHNRNRQDRPRPERSNNDDAEGSLGESPPRPRNQNQRPRQQPPHQQQQQQQNRSPQEGSAPRRPIHPQQLRSERRSAPAPPSDEPMGHSQQHTPNRTRRQNYRQPNKESDRNNITVEITDGEVRSVKLKSSERTFGTGRVGYSRPENMQKFTVDTFNPENTGESREPDKSPGDKSRNRNPRSNHNRRNQKPKEQTPFQHPTLENIIITKTSVQERLVKIAKDKDAEVKVELQPTASEADNGN